MKLLQVSGQEWHVLSYSLAAGNAPTDAFVLLGPSEEIAEQAQALLEETSQQHCQIRYFLCSGSSIFRVPCFLRFTAKPLSPEPVDAGLFIATRLAIHGLRLAKVMIGVVSDLEEARLGTSQSPQLIVVEYLTPPSTLELSFTHHLLSSVVPQHVPLLLLVHQHRSSVGLPWFPSEDLKCLLAQLYLCGGRLRHSEWYKLLTCLPKASQHRAEDLFASRQVGSQKWICYASRQVAELAADCFEGLEPARKSELAHILLHILPPCTGYPLLAIASQADDLQTMLAVYSRTAAELALAEPKGLVSYFGRLRQVAYSAGDAPTTDNAFLLSLDRQAFLDESSAIRVYHKAREGLPASLEKKVRRLFWYVLGERLVNIQPPEALEYAAECFRLSRECVEDMDQANHDSICQSLASIANGEAFIAFKLHQGEKARQLEEFALAQLRGLDQTRTLQVYLRTHLGDVLLRLLDDVEGALEQYNQALLTAFAAGQASNGHGMALNLFQFKEAAALKLGKTLMQLERYDEAIKVLEHLLSNISRIAGSRVMAAQVARELKVRSTLAQAYLQAGQGRKAALCYWQILRYPQRLEPAILQEVVERLGRCRPALPGRLQERVKRIVQEQEALLADILKVQDVLFAMESSPR